MNEELRKIYAGIVELKNEFSYMSNEEIKEKLTKMQSDFLDIYNCKKMVMTMATTKIWAINDSISRVISYAKNPEKTTFVDLKQVLKYTEDDEKTIDKNEKTMYVTGVNCKTKTAYEEMTLVQMDYVENMD